MYCVFLYFLVYIFYASSFNAALMSIEEHKNYNRHEAVHYFHDEMSGLRAFICVHSTRLGPSAGGTRLWHYADSHQALGDALNLSAAMSYKNAMAGIPFGGGKGVILRPEGEFDRKSLFAAYGKAVDSLGGKYFAAEDVGVSPSDMEVVKGQTNYVAGLDSGQAASGDPSPVTADGVFRGLKVAIRHRLGKESFDGLHIAVQGLGHVGFNLCQRLFKAGAHLSVADINKDVLDKAKSKFGARITDIDEIHTVNADIFAPCALGGSINSKTWSDIKAPIIGGAANNQLQTTDMGEKLRQAGILYAPDYVINGGGIINVAAELSGNYDKAWVDKKLDGLEKNLETIFAISDREGRSTNSVADEIAEKLIYGDAK